MFQLKRNIAGDWMNPALNLQCSTLSTTYLPETTCFQIQPAYLKYTSSGSEMNLIQSESGKEQKIHDVQLKYNCG